MIRVHLRSGKVIEAVAPTSFDSFMMDDTGQTIKLTDSEDVICKYLVRKDAIDYVEVFEED